MTYLFIGFLEPHFPRGREKGRRQKKKKEEEIMKLPNGLIAVLVMLGSGDVTLSEYADLREAINGNCTNRDLITYFEHPGFDCQGAPSFAIEDRYYDHLEKFSTVIIVGSPDAVYNELYQEKPEAYERDNLTKVLFLTDSERISVFINQDVVLFRYYECMGRWSELNDQMMRFFLPEKKELLAA